MLQHYLLLWPIPLRLRQPPQPPATSTGECSLDTARYMFNLRLIKPAEPSKFVHNRSENVPFLSNVFRTLSFSLLFRQRAFNLPLGFRWRNRSEKGQATKVSTAQQQPGKPRQSCKSRFLKGCEQLKSTNISETIAVCSHADLIRSSGSIHQTYFLVIGREGSSL